MKSKMFLFMILSALALSKINLYGGEKVSVRLQDGDVITMEEPADMMDMNWEKAQKILPAVFTYTSPDASTNVEKIRQMAVTVRTLGHFYIRRGDRVLGVGESGAEMTDVEEAVRRIREGEASRAEEDALDKAEAVSLWSAMLTDYAKENNIPVQDGSQGNLNPYFLQIYVDMLKDPADSDVLREFLEALIKNNPEKITAVLKDAPLKEREAINEVILPIENNPN
jgi:hypothetical protein